MSNSMINRPNFKELLALKINQSAMNVRIGQQMTVNGKKYKVIEKYPYIIRLRAKDGKTITLNKADLVTARGNAVSNSNGKGKAIKCLTDGKRYNSVRTLAKELGYAQYSQLVEKINNIKLIDGKLYRWV